MNNGNHYCELSQAHGRIAHLIRLLEEANAIIDILQGRTFLGRRERQILELSACGLSMKEMAIELGLAVKTVEDYRTRVMHKLRVHDVVRLTHCAIKLGVIASPSHRAKKPAKEKDSQEYHQRDH